MRSIAWRELYASNQAAIERAGGARPPRPAVLHGSAGPAVPAPGAASDVRRFMIAGRSRRAMVHVPDGMAPRSAVPLVCMLHGCTQNAATFAAATMMNEAADRHGFIVVYPEQERGDNAQGCWNWFLPEHQARGTGEPAAIAGMVRKLIGIESPATVDARRVFVAGLSSGGAMAAILAATYPDLFAAAAIHSGLAYGSATSLGAAFSAMAGGAQVHGRDARPLPAEMGRIARPVPSIVIHGTADRTVAPINATQVLEQSMTANHLAAPERGEFSVERPTVTWRVRLDGGHAHTRSRWTDRRGGLMHELLMVDGLGHAWSGGAVNGSHADPRGPSATEAVWRFFTEATAAA